MPAMRRGREWGRRAVPAPGRPDRVDACWWWSCRLPREGEQQQLGDGRPAECCEDLLVPAVGVTGAVGAVDVPGTAGQRWAAASVVGPGHRVSRGEQAGAAGQTLGFEPEA